MQRVKCTERRGVTQQRGEMQENLFKFTERNLSVEAAEGTLKFLPSTREEKKEGENKTKKKEKHPLNFEPLVRLERQLSDGSHLL